MDTSETYIKMCEEIQSLRPQTMVSSADHYERVGYQFDIDSQGNVRYWDDGKFIWLPRQDDLQKMVWSHTSGTYNMLGTKLFAFSDYWEENGIPTEFISMEQLWMAFMMHENHNKVWDGEAWT